MLSPALCICCSLQQICVVAEAHVNCAKIICPDKHYCNLGIFLGSLSILQPVQQVVYLVPCTS